MSEVISYEGRVRVQGRVADFQNIIDPQTWSQNFPFIWPHSFLIAGPELPADRDAQPPAKPRDMSNPRRGMLFEQVRFGPIVYSNVINTELVLGQEGGADVLRFDYSEVDCRTTEFLGEIVDGGIDVDTGAALCVSEAEPGFVTVTITKAVRFTEPSPLVDFAQPFFDALVKVTLDALLHSLIFEGP
jgi:hypothetical protein